MYENYRRLRDARGYKDADVSKATGIARSTLSDWKNGKSNPKTNKLQLIADFLDVKLTDLTNSNEIEYDSENHTWDINKEYYVNLEAKEMAQFLFENPQYRALFDASRKVKAEDLQKALKAIGIFIED